MAKRMAWVIVASVAAFLFSGFDISHRSQDAGAGWSVSLTAS